MRYKFLKKILGAVIIVIILAINLVEKDTEWFNKKTPGKLDSYDYVIDFPEEKYPETAAHIKEAINNGESQVCTIDRKGADENRELSLAGIPTKKGYDRDEWPMAMCEEGGNGASVEYVLPSDNRGAGSWVGNRLEDYPDGTKVLFNVE